MMEGIKLLRLSDNALRASTQPVGVSELPETGTAT
jgi:hypothetical protein